MVLNIRWLLARRKAGGDAAPADLRGGEIAMSEPGNRLIYGFGGDYGGTPAATHTLLRSDGTRLWHDAVGAADGSTVFTGVGSGLTGVPWAALTGAPTSGQHAGASVTITAPAGRTLLIWGTGAWGLSALDHTLTLSYDGAAIATQVVKQAATADRTGLSLCGRVTAVASASCTITATGGTLYGPTITWLVL